MGNTTVIELDHDRTKELVDSPYLFFKAIYEQLTSMKHTGKEIPGGRVISAFHRGDTEEDKLWNRYKEQVYRHREMNYERANREVEKDLKRRSPEEINKEIAKYVDFQKRP